MKIIFGKKVEKCQECPKYFSIEEYFWLPVKEKGKGYPYGYNGGCRQIYSECPFDETDVIKKEEENKHDENKCPQCGRKLLRPCMENVRIHIIWQTIEEYFEVDSIEAMHCSEDIFDRLSKFMTIKTEKEKRQ